MNESNHTLDWPQKGPFFIQANLNRFNNTTDLSGYYLEMSYALTVEKGREGLEFI